MPKAQKTRWDRHFAAYGPQCVQLDTGGCRARICKDTHIARRINRECRKQAELVGTGRFKQAENVGMGWFRAVGLPFHAMYHHVPCKFLALSSRARRPSARRSPTLNMMDISETRHTALPCQIPVKLAALPPRCDVQLPVAVCSAAAAPVA